MTLRLRIPRLRLRWLRWLRWLLVNKRAQTSRVTNIPSFFCYSMLDDMMLRGIDLKSELKSHTGKEDWAILLCGLTFVMTIGFCTFYYSSYTLVTQMPRLPPRKKCSRCGFSKEESESLCQRCRNGQEPYLTYVRTASRCTKYGGVKNDVEQICEYCRNAQELPKIIRPLRPTVLLRE
jgi:hypothetical protein